MQTGRTFLESVGSRQNLDAYQQEHWQGSFEEYLDIVRQKPKVTRNAHQRVYDMVVAYGTYEIEDGKDSLTRYRFFDDPENDVVVRRDRFGPTAEVVARENQPTAVPGSVDSSRRSPSWHGT